MDNSLDFLNEEAERASFISKIEQWTKRIYFPAKDKDKLYEEALQRAEELNISDKFKQIVEETIRKQEKLNALALICPESKLSLQEIGTAQTFGELYKPELRYNSTSETFYFYNGHYWNEDSGKIHAQTLAKEFYQLCMSYAFDYIHDENIRNNFVDVYGKYSSKRNRDTLISDAITILAISESDFDKNLNLLNVRNGTINLETFKLQAHDPEDLLTNYTDVEYIPNAHSDLWESFISSVFPNDKPLQRYVRAAIGYSITGNPKLERMFIFYGKSTRNGKSTMLNTISHVLGSYAKSAPAELLQLKVKDSRVASEDLARLSRCRFLTISEPAQTMVFDVPLIKSLTGRDIITARRLYEKSFEYVPKFSMFLNTNYLPKVLDDSLFSSDRVDVIPFTKHFTAQEQDTSLKQKLQTDENKSAVLWWILTGLNDFYSHGLLRPLSVATETRLYVQQSDKLQSFIDEVLEPVEQPCLTLKDCYTAFKDWCASCGYYTENKSKFIELLEHKNLLLRSATIDGKTVKRVINGYKLQ